MTIKGGERFVTRMTPNKQAWIYFQAIGDIAFSYAYATVLIEIQVN